MNRAESGRMDGIIETNSFREGMAKQPQPFRIRMMTSAEIKKQNGNFYLKLSTPQFFVIKNPSLNSKPIPASVCMPPAR